MCGQSFFSTGTTGRPCSAAFTIAFAASCNCRLADMVATSMRWGRSGSSMISSVGGAAIAWSDQTRSHPQRAAQAGEVVRAGYLDRPEPGCMLGYKLDVEELEPALAQAVHQVGQGHLGSIAHTGEHGLAGEVAVDRKREAAGPNGAPQPARDVQALQLENRTRVG